MCLHECFGNYHRGCGHYIRSYYTGEKTDCGRPTCGLSVNHMHKTAINCRCNKVAQDDQRIVNMFQVPCDNCKAAEFERIARR